MTTEDEFPTVISRPRSDTMPSPGVLQFPGGQVNLPEQSIRALKDSAFEWVAILSSEVFHLQQAMLAGDRERWSAMRARVRAAGMRLECALADVEAKCPR